MQAPPMQQDSDQEDQDDKKNPPVKKADKEKQYKNQGPSKQLLLTPEQFYKATFNYRNTLRSVVGQHPAKKPIELVDVGLRARGPSEDIVYSNYCFYRNNVRRGNTLIVEGNKARWARRGLQKFFDITVESIKAIREDDIKSIKTKNDQTLHYVIFQQLENALSFNDDIEDPNHKCQLLVYRLSKANGENTQVSFDAPTGDWIVASKNVAIMVGKKDDLKVYRRKDQEAQRYSFAILMAETWFDLLEKLNPHQIELVKKTLATHTIIGEYCGNQDFQHLVKYAETTIYFYALVNNDSTKSCEPPAVAFQFLQAANLPIVKNYQHSLRATLTSMKALGELLDTQYQQVASSSIFDDQEGSVLYFVLQQPREYCQHIADHYMQQTVPIPPKFEDRPVWRHVASLGKLKTLQYRLLRKLREKLRHLVAPRRPGMAQQQPAEELNHLQKKYASFQRESYSLVRAYKLPKPIEYYFCIALLAFNYTFTHRKNARALKTLNENYLDFLSVVFWCVENKKEITPNLIGDQALHQQLRAETWKNYSIEIVNDYQKLLQEIVPKYAKIRKSTTVEELIAEAQEDGKGRKDND